MSDINHYPSGNEESLDVTVMWSQEERKGLVIVIPNAMKETDLLQMNEVNPNHLLLCRIIHLGKLMAHERFETSDRKYRTILSQLIALGVPVIRQESLVETNAKFLKAYPDAEGLRIKGG